MNGVVPSTVVIRWSAPRREQGADDVGAGLDPAASEAAAGAAVRRVGRDPQRRGAAQVSGPAGERLQRALLRDTDVAHDHRRRRDPRVDVSAARQKGFHQGETARRIDIDRAEPAGAIAIAAMTQRRRQRHRHRRARHCRSLRGQTSK
jgi:hypothetical protein